MELLLASLLALFLLSNTCNAQEPKKHAYWELSTLLRYAEEHNIDIQVTRNKFLKQRMEVEMYKSAYLPKIGVYADYLWYFSEVPLLIFPGNSFEMMPTAGSNGYNPINVGLPNNVFTGISLTQRLFDFGFFQMKQGSELFDNIESAGFELKRAELFHSIAITWYELVQLYEKEKYIDFNRARIDHYLAIVRRQIQNEMADSLQLIELIIKHSQLIISNQEYQSGIKRKTRYLKMLAGVPDTVDFVVQTVEMGGFITFESKEESEIDIMQLKLLDYNQQLKSLSKKKIRSDYSPSLDLHFNLLYNWQSDKFPSSNSEVFSNNISSLGVRLDIPIYDGSEKRRKLKMIDVENSIIDMQKEKLKSGIGLQVYNVFEELGFKRKLFQNQKELVLLKERRLSKITLHFERGLTNIKELLEIHSDLMDEQMKLEELFLEVKILELDYMNLTGQLGLLLNDI
jgi:outer membrane protein TolC